MTKPLIDQAVDRFLGWKLPEDFSPDGGITFKPFFNGGTPHQMRHGPCGTNLFHAGQAKAMLEYVLGGGAGLEVLAERQRQIDVEGWTPGHDDGHDEGELGMAAACYAMEGASNLTIAGDEGEPPSMWPWGKEWWKPSPEPRRNLVKAAALILAEIERLDRIALKG